MLDFEGISGRKSNYLPMDGFCGFAYRSCGVWGGACDSKPEMGIYGETGEGIVKKGLSVNTDF